jgi:DMSO/TMAO reductase YedYZ molybdopterin-dependent catalytic subunit
LKFTTFADPKTMRTRGNRGIRGLTMQEAMNRLAFLSAGMYGKTVPPQDGVPFCATVPWKYGLKSTKSIVRTDVAAIHTDKTKERLFA